MTAAPSPDTRWEPLTIDQVADLFRGAGVRWWLSGGAALEHWLGRPIRERTNIDVSAMAGDVPALLGDLQGLLSAWTDVDGTLVPLADAPAEADLSSVEIHDDERGVWVLRVHGEDGAPKAWLYRRDPRLQLPWDKAVIDVDGVPTGAPAVQLIWKALRPRPEDELDKDAVLPELSADEREILETALLRIHPHSSWAIHVRSPFGPAKASWNRKGR